MRIHQGLAPVPSLLVLAFAGCGGNVTTQAASSGAPHPATTTGTGGRATIVAGAGGSTTSRGPGFAGVPAASGGAAPVTPPDLDAGVAGGAPGVSDASVPGVDGAGGAPVIPVCAPLLDAGGFIPTARCGSVARAALPRTAGGWSPSAAAVTGGLGIAVVGNDGRPETARSIHVYDVSGQCIATLGAEEHAYNINPHILSAQVRGDVAAVLVGCESDNGPCGSTLYVNGNLVLDVTEYPPDPLSAMYNSMTVTPDGNLFVATDLRRIGETVLHRARLLRPDGFVLKDVMLPDDDFTTSAVAAPSPGNYAVARVGQPAPGKSRSELASLDQDLKTVVLWGFREDIEVNALATTASGDVIAAGQEGAPDPYGFVAAYSMPDLQLVWPSDPKFPLGYARAVDVAPNGEVWVLGDDPNYVLWLASYDPTSMVVTVEPSPGTALSYAFWSLATRGNGSVLFAQGDVYSYCR